MPKPYMDVGFVIPLEEEFERLVRYFPKVRDWVSGTFYHAELEMGVTGVSGVAFLQDDMGKAAATRAADALLAKYDVGIVFVVGISGGISSDVALGDVCFSGTIIDVLENAKVTDHRKGATKTEFSPKFYKTDHHLSFSLRYSKLGSDVRGRFENWQLEQYYDAIKLVPGEFIGRAGKNEVVGIPQIHDGSIVCGQVAKSDVYKGKLQGIDRKALALETESGGVFHSAQAAGVHVVAVRGICDYADGNKNKLEDQTNGQARQIAANNAVSFVAMQFHNPQFLKFLEIVRGGGADEQGPRLDLGDTDDFLGLTLHGVGKSIQEQLSILSPGYRATDKEYRLPLPRVRARSSNVTVSPVIEKSEAISVLEAIATGHVIAIGLPRSYPDNSLPWVIAAGLLLIEIDGKQAVPIVIDSDLVKPPHSALASQTTIDLGKLDGCGKARPVFILTDLPPNSRSRIDALAAEVKKYPEAKFVIINKGEHNIADESELVLSLAAKNYDVCDVAFVDIADFFQRSMDMGDQESGVLALRLHDMFDRFELSAHPTYFAGIGSDVIYSLLKANRRSELLQLAVSGYLSFVVATDDAQTVLSRTTREAFLRTLAFEQKVMKRTFTKADLVGFVDKFADDNDYEIDSISFLKAFQDKGLIHYDGGQARISLPFIESYLLAQELVSREKEAVQYFDLSEPDFDFSTFDIYAELGPHSAIIDSVSETLDQMISQIAARNNGQHILLTDEIRPRIIERRSRLRELHEKLEKAYDDVTHSRPNNVEKQRLLDIAARVQGTARNAQENLSRDSRKEQNTELSRLQDPMRVWGVATMLLGSGSERLPKGPKRELASRIVRATSVLIDALLRAFPRLGFEEFKADLQSEKTLREIFEIPPDEAIEDSLKEFVGAIVDAYEFALLGYPLRVMLEELGNGAGQKVLEPSIASVSSTDVMEDLVAKIWASEINAAKHKDGLIKAIKELPPSPFLRFSLSTHFLTRVFWNHWERGNRMALLDAAEASLSPLTDGKLDRARLQRMITSKPGEADAEG